MNTDILRGIYAAHDVALDQIAKDEIMVQVLVEDYNLASGEARDQYEVMDKMFKLRKKKGGLPRLTDRASSRTST